MPISAAGKRHRRLTSRTMALSTRSTASSPPAAIRHRTRRVLPGFGLTLGYTMVYLCLLVLIPLSAVFVRSFGSGWLHFWEVVTSPRVLASLRLSFGASLFAASVNAVFGLL